MNGIMNGIKNTRRNGFSIILVIMVMVLISAGVVVISAIAQQMLFETKRSQLEAGTRNLTASGLAWAKINYNKLSATPADKEIFLDVSELEISDGGLSIANPKAEAMEHTVKITIRQKYHNKDIDQTASFHLSPTVTK